jgi:hypothetical protein
MRDVEDTLQITCRPHGLRHPSATSMTAKRELQTMFASTFTIVAPEMTRTLISFHRRSGQHRDMELSREDRPNGAPSTTSK